MLISKDNCHVFLDLFIFIFNPFSFFHLAHTITENATAFLACSTTRCVLIQLVFNFEIAVFQTFLLFQMGGQKQQTRKIQKTL